MAIPRLQRLVWFWASFTRHFRCQASCNCVLPSPWPCELADTGKVISVFSEPALEPEATTMPLPSASTFMSSIRAWPASFRVRQKRLNVELNESLAGTIGIKGSDSLNGVASLPQQTSTSPTFPFLCCGTGHMIWPSARIRSPPNKLLARVSLLARSRLLLPPSLP